MIDNFISIISYFSLFMACILSCSKYIYSLYLKKKGKIDNINKAVSIEAMLITIYTLTIIYSNLSSK